MTSKLQALHRARGPGEDEGVTRQQPGQQLERSTVEKEEFDAYFWPWRRWPGRDRLGRSC